MRSLVELNRLLAMMDVAVQQVEWRELTGPIEQAAAPAGCMIVTYVTSGTIGANLPGRAERRCGAGTMILVPAALPSSFRAIDGEPPAGLIIGLVEVRLSGSGLLDRVKVPIFADLLGAPLVRQAMNELVQLHSGGTTALGVSALSDSLMKTCLLIVLQDFFGRPGIDLKIIGALADQRLATVIAAVIERPGDPHSLAQMAALAGLSRSTFSRLFGEAMGQSPTEFVAKTRLYYAAELLRTSGAPIKSVAVSVGFSSRSHFSHAFRAAYGMDPTAYRQAQAGDRPTPVPQDLKRIAFRSNRAS